MVWGAKLNTTEFTWFVSLYIFTDHYLFQCHRAIFFGCLQAAGEGGRRGSIAIENFKCARHSLVSIFYYMAHHGWARKNIFKIEVLSWLEGAIFSLVSENNGAFY